METVVALLVPSPAIERMSKHFFLENRKLRVNPLRPTGIIVGPLKYVCTMQIMTHNDASSGGRPSAWYLASKRDE